jgi:hypothetical protein
LGIRQVGNLTVSHLDRIGIGNEAAKETSPLNKFGNRRSEDLVQLHLRVRVFLNVLCISITISVSITIRSYIDWIDEQPQLRIFVVLQNLRVQQPGKRLAIDTPWLLKL